jgi:glycogen debranching enzyme/glycosyltransferase involved in cell wall biosynthesis
LLDEKKTMKIAQIAPLAERCPPRLYGGTERIVSYLTDELVRQGHDVTLFASGDSLTRAELVPSSDMALRLNNNVLDHLPYHLVMLDAVRRRAAEFDVLHFHVDLLQFPIIHGFSDKTLTTLHGRQDLPDLLPFYKAFQDVPLASISYDQRRPLPAHVNWAGNVYHGLPRDLLQFAPAPSGNYLVFLGRISPEKRPDRAIEIAVRAGLPLIMAAKVDKVDQAYWDDIIEPLVQRHACVNYIGEINEQQKADLLGNALGLLFPIDWPEPFGLVMIEAMACGTPIIAFRSGAVGEIIDHGITGFIVDDVTGAVEAVSRTKTLDRNKVRQEFEKRFTVERMARDYLDIYRSLASNPRAATSTNGGQKMRPAPASVEDAPAEQYSVPANASLPERQLRTLKHDDIFAVFDGNGDAVEETGNPTGIYYRDTRYLSALSLTLDGARPILLSSTIRDDNATLTCDLSNPDLYRRTGELALGHDLIHIRRTRFLFNTACFERISIRNFDDKPCIMRLAIRFSADFADLFEVRGSTRAARGTNEPPDVTTGQVTLSYTGLDHKRRSTRLRFDPAPAKLTSSEAIFEIELAPYKRQLVFVEINCDPATEGSPVHRAFFLSLRDARRALRKLVSGAASVTTSNETFNESVRRNVADLYLLTTKTPQGSYPYAGIPWFSTVFGRDALITALQTLWLDPSIASGVLGYLAANQADRVDEAADAEPGKILHEVRHGEMAELGEVPFRRYYGSIDSTPLFIMLAGAYLERTGDLAKIRDIWPNIERALAWIENYGDRDGDGFVEYGRRTEQGLANQGWKDSQDAIFHADGKLARGTIALAEVQAYVYAAWQAAADIACQLGEPGRADEWREKAEALRQRFDKAFFDLELGTYVLALDGEKRPCRVRSSNAGHALFTGIAFPERATPVVAALMAGSSFSGWGLRTVASTEARYNPMSYHNGSVWPHDNALVASGFARYGFRREAGRIFGGLFAASTYIDLRRLPELFCGFPRQRSNGPTFYPVACSPQAWAAAAALSLIQSCLGLSFDVAASEIILERPVLPDFLNSLTIRGLSLQGGSVDLSVSRAGSEVAVTVLERRGDIRVLIRN